MDTSLFTASVRYLETLGVRSLLLLRYVECPTLNGPFAPVLILSVLLGGRLL